MPIDIVYKKLMAVNSQLFRHAKIGYKCSAKSEQTVKNVETAREKIYNCRKEQDKDNRGQLGSGIVTSFTIINRKQNNLDLFSYAHLYGFLTVGTSGYKHSFGIENRIAKNYFCAMGTIADIGFIFVHTVFYLWAF